MRPLIDAHRGECGIPGLPAADRYRCAVGLGVDFVEIDIRRISDGMFVNYHDDLTPAGRAVRDLSYPELKDELGADLVKIDELIEIVDGNIGLHVDVKEEGYEAEVVRLIESSFTRSEVVFTSGDDQIRAIKEQFPSVRAGLSLGDDLTGALPWREARARLSRSRADFVVVHERVARAGMLDRCARARVPAWVWTVNDEADIARFMGDSRVAVLITGRPDIALRFRKA